MDDRALIQKLLDGDESAFRWLIGEYQAVMSHVARAIVGPAIADEVVQESWISIIRALGQFEGRSSLKTWIIQIVGNQAKTRRRKESRQTSVGDANDVEDAISALQFHTDGHWQSSPAIWNFETPDQIVENEQLGNLISNTIEKLPDNQRDVLKLRDIEGLEIDEICKILDLTESNTRVLLHRARTKVWQAIDRHQRGEE